LAFVPAAISGDEGNAMNLPPLIQALLMPHRYGAGVTSVTLVSTHISWVLLAGEFAYKIKKPIKLSFLDFSTLQQRQFFCMEELRLNQRYSPDIYLAVIGIYHSSDDPQWQGTGSPIEYAIKMRRFEQDDRLDRVCLRGELLHEHLSDLARRVTVFHRNAAIAIQSTVFGSAALVLEQALQNFDDLLPMLSSENEQQRLLRLRKWTLAQHSKWAELMQTRQATGYVRECHGDLHLGNLFLRDASVRMFDCVEFNETLRWIDVASDIAFTYEDLMAQGRPDLACWFLNEALGCSGDYASAPLLRFYAVYRALVRAKVSLIQHAQDGQSREKALNALALAERLSSPPDVHLVITHGASGSGKTYMTDKLLKADTDACILRLRTDVERKRRFHLDPLKTSESGLNADLYSQQNIDQTYADLLKTAEILLRANWSVIVDGAFLHRSQRDCFCQLANTLKVSFIILAPLATQEQMMVHVKQRLARGDDASEATLAVLRHQQATLEPLTPEELGCSSTAQDSIRLSKRQISQSWCWPVDAGDSRRQQVT
jgi:aminoglycoside phosphotransferase family enzyme/predicted kinase